MSDLSPEASRLLLTAKQDDDIWFINRTLGFRTWESLGQQWTRPDVAELYRCGLIEEWFNPATPPCALTPDGVATLARLRSQKAPEDSPAPKNEV